MSTTVVERADDPRLDDYRALNDQAFRRRYEGDDLFIVEGYVAIDRLIESGHQIRSVLLAPSRVERFAANAAILAGQGIAVYEASRDVIADVVGFDLHRGVLACAQRRPLARVDELLAGATRLAVLEGLNDNENLGAIARAAKAFGIDGLLLDPTCTDPYSRRTVRVSMGEVLTLPISRAEPDRWPEVLGDLRAAGFEVWAMTPAVSADDAVERGDPRSGRGAPRRRGAGADPSRPRSCGSSGPDPDQRRGRFTQRRPGRRRHLRRPHPPLTPSFRTRPRRRPGCPVSGRGGADGP